MCEQVLQKLLDLNDVDNFDEFIKEHLKVGASCKSS